MTLPPSRFSSPLAQSCSGIRAGYLGLLPSGTLLSELHPGAGDGLGAATLPKSSTDSPARTFWVLRKLDDLRRHGWEAWAGE